MRVKPGGTGELEPLPAGARAACLAIDDAASEMIGAAMCSIVVSGAVNAAKAIANRSGLGKLKHLDVKYLWLQNAIKQKRLTCVDAEFNRGDL